MSAEDLNRWAGFLAVKYGIAWPIDTYEEDTEECSDTSASR